MNSHDQLRNAFADRVELHPMEDWAPALLTAVIAVMDLHFAEAGTHKAPVLELVRR